MNLLIFNNIFINHFNYNILTLVWKMGFFLSSFIHSFDDQIVFAKLPPPFLILACFD